MENAKKVENVSVEKYFSEVYDRIPAGVTEKSDTGMGATHVEINSNRNSIIVEPLRATAYNKVLKHKKESKNPAIYAGTHPFDPLKTLKIDRIENYIHKMDELKLNKKIICVADSLQKVYNRIKRMGRLDEFFLLIDEIDSFQNDSSYRYKLGNCIDIYEQFKPENRGVLTATPIAFSNPILKAEPKTIVSLNNIKKRNLRIVKFFKGYNLLEREILNVKDEGKVVIVLNVVSDIMGLIKRLEKKGVNSDDIAVLCSSNNETRIGKYYKTIVDEKYPARINFLTSAYFTGYDIQEKYHLFYYSSVLKPTTLLSIDQLKQISGRCRVGPLLSETLFYRPFGKNEKVRYDFETTEESLMKLALALLRSKKCIGVNLEGLEDEIRLVENMRDLLIRLTEKIDKQVIRRNIEEELVVSFLNIDSILENLKTIQTCYLESSDIVKSLKEKNVEATIEEIFDNEEEDSIQNELYKEQMMTFYKLLDDLKSEVEFKILLILGELLEDKSINIYPLQKEIIKFIFSCNSYVEPSEMIGHILKAVINKKGELYRDRRKLNNLILSFNFKIGGPDFNLRIMLEHYFNPGDVISKEELTERMRSCFIKSSLFWNEGEISDKELMTKANLFLILQRVKLENKIRIKGIIPYLELLPFEKINPFFEDKVVIE